jgi:alkanesulfonate monooxygenase SsuD/methylene tetrahydromethanopterin reductase-like flavin-dependent oxidoreductase (luciferase family)
MQLGYFAMPLHPPGCDYRQVLEENRQAIILADRLGYAEAWMGEHFTSLSEPVTHPFMFFATVVPETENIRFGSAVHNLPYHHPAHLAAQIAMFDQMSGGRTLVGIGPGGLPSDTEFFGITPDVGHRMMAECADIMVRLWTEDPPHEIEGEFWTLRIRNFTLPEIGVGAMPKPLQKPHPPIAYPMRSPKSGSARLCAERDWIPFSGNFIPAGYVKSQWDDYAAHCEELGKPANRDKWRVGRSLLVAESDAQADEYVAKAEGGFRYYFHYLRTLEVKRQMADATPHEFQAEVETRVNESLEDQVIAGSADTVLDKLIAFRDEVGHFGTLVATGHDWDEPELWRSSMARLAQDVMPRFRQHAEATAA